MRSNLSQHGGWSRDLEAKVREAMELRFSEMEDTFDFALCQRPDSSVYGIADGKRCIKGRPITRNDALRSLAKKGIPRSILGKLAATKSDKEFGKAVRALNDSAGKRTQQSAVRPVKPGAPKIAPKDLPRGGVDAAAKRKEATGKDARAEKKGMIAQQRAEARARLKERQRQAPEAKPATARKTAAEPAKKPIEQQKAEAQKANMKAAAKEPKKRISTVPGNSKTSTQLLIEELFPGVDGTPDPGDIKAKQKVYLELEKRWGAEKAERMLREVAPLLSIATTDGRALSSTPTSSEIQRMQQGDIQKKLREGYNDPSKLIGGRFEYNKDTKRLDFTPNDGEGQIIPMKWKDIDDDMAWAYYKLAPASFRKSIDKAGGPKERAFMGYDEDGNPIHGSKSGNDPRRLHLTKLWMVQGGRDAYTGLPLAFGNADLEHIVPMEKLGKDAENPNNWVWVSAAVNQRKSASTMDFFLDGKGPEKQANRFNGVNNITDFARWDQYVASKTEAAKIKKTGGASLKTNAQEVLDKLRADNDTRESTIATYRGAKKTDNRLDKVLKYMADLEPAMSSQQGFRREIRYKDKNGEFKRNAAKPLMLSDANFTVGQVKGKMTMAEWMVREWPNLSGSQRVRAANMWEEIVQDWAENGTKRGQSKGWIAQEFARRAEEILQ